MQSKRPNFLSDTVILGSMPDDKISESKKLLVLLSNRLLASGVTSGSVILTA